MLQGSRRPSFTMKLFKTGSGKTRPQPEPAQQPADASIGSALSSRDQFDVIVLRQSNDVTASRTLSRNHQQKLRSGGLLGYFGHDDLDHSTVSSITVEENKKFGLFHSPKNRGFSNASAHSSWCCCSDNTAPTEHTADNNTLMQSGRSVRSAHAADPYTQARYRAITLQQQESQAHQSWLAAASCAPVCGLGTEPTRATKPRRPRLFRRQPTTIPSNKSSRSLMSSSLFDTLSEDWDDEDGGRRLAVMRRKSQQLRKSLISKRGKQQAI